LWRSGLEFGKGAEGSLLFLKKKKQKDFCVLGACTAVSDMAGEAGGGAKIKSLFASFSSEKEESLS
jgi:hypothetical protein